MPTQRELPTKCEPEYSVMSTSGAYKLRPIPHSYSPQSFPTLPRCSCTISEVIAETADSRSTQGQISNLLTTCTSRTDLIPKLFAKHNTNEVLKWANCSAKAVLVKNPRGSMFSFKTSKIN